MKSLYDILDVKKTASLDEIKSNFRKLATKYHPDKGGDANKFKEISSAYDILKDSEKRSLYDQGLIDETGAPKQHFNRGRSGFGNQYEEMHIDLNDFNDIFSSIFRQNQRNRNPNQDVRITYSIDYLEAFTGKTAEITYSINGAEKTAKFNIPPGIDNGTIMKLSGMGLTKDPRFPVGDLLVTIYVTPHPIFKRDGNNLFMNQNIDVWEALLGCSKEVELIDKSKIKINIPAGTQPGQTLKIAGKGFTSMHKIGNGDLFVNLSITIPTLNNEQKNFLSSNIDKLKKNI